MVSCPLPFPVSLTDTFRFASIEMMEPGKQEVLAWRVGEAVPRRSFAVVWNRSDNKTYEATVDLTGDAAVPAELTAPLQQSRQQQGRICTNGG